MTRLERINFIRTHSPAHRNTNFADYDDNDVYGLYLDIPLSPELDKQRSMDHGILFYWYEKLGNVIFYKNMPAWLFIPTLAVYIAFLNPVSVIIECLALIIWICYIIFN